MDWDDALVFKLHDSLQTEATGENTSHKDNDHSLTSTVCPHSAFLDPTAPEGSSQRESIEIKAIVIG